MDRFKRGDKHPSEDLYFWQMKRGNPYWVSSSELQRRRGYNKAYNRDRYSDPTSGYAKRSREKSRAYRQANHEKIREQMRRWRRQNIEHLRDYFRKYHRERRKGDPLFCLSSRMRTRITDAFRLRVVPKKGKTRDMLGCDWPTLKAHIESQFTGGMSWGRFAEIHIDHIVPLSSAKNEQELEALCHYTNLQPLWAKDNQRKGCKPDYLMVDPEPPTL